MQIRKNTPATSQTSFLINDLSPSIHLVKFHIIIFGPTSHCMEMKMRANKSHNNLWMCSFLLLWPSILFMCAYRFLCLKERKKLFFWTVINSFSIGLIDKKRSNKTLLSDPSSWQISGSRQRTTLVHYWMFIVVTYFSSRRCAHVSGVCINKKIIVNKKIKSLYFAFHTSPCGQHLHVSTGVSRV